MNALLYSANTGSQVLTSGQTINFGTPIRRYGKHINISGGNVTVVGDGYYPMQASVTFTANGAGIATLQLFENGAPIPGATVSKTVGDGSVYSLEFPAVVKIRCCEEKTITAAVFNVPVTVSNAAILVEKA